MQHSTEFISYLSPAKLNLGLKITGKRDDGYHLLNTTFCLIDLFDSVHIRITDTPQILLLDHTREWPSDSDLAFRAAKLLQKITGSVMGANIKVSKVIPCGAGLGGGSSNAATVLLALNQLWQLSLTLNELIDIGRILGADVPFFIYGKNAYATGIGDQLESVTLPQYYFVLVKPDFDIPTKAIFSAFTLPAHLNNTQHINSYNTPCSNIDTGINKTKNDIGYPLNISDPVNPQHSPGMFYNDLEAVAIKLYPRLGEIIKDLSIHGNTAMTGSGSAVFIAFKNLKNANKVAHNLRKRYNTYLVKSIAISPTVV